MPPLPAFTDRRESIKVIWKSTDQNLPAPGEDEMSLAELDIHITGVIIGGRFDTHVIRGGRSWKVVSVGTPVFDWDARDKFHPTSIEIGLEPL